jgi:hypothetical protein
MGAGSQHGHLAGQAMCGLEFAAMRKNSCELKKDLLDIFAPGNIARVEESQIGDVCNRVWRFPKLLDDSRYISIVS